MTTITVWLLIALGVGNSSGAPNTVAQFATQEACEATRREAIEKLASFYSRQSACIKATVVKP